jgi:predicted DNA-binding transcriptional regulator YafY
MQFSYSIINLKNRKGDNMASFDKTFQFLSILTKSRRITITNLANSMGCSRRHAYRLVDLASRHIPIRLEEGVVINEGLNSSKRRS